MKEKKFSYLLNDLRNYNEMFRKDVTYDNIKSLKKKQGFTMSLKSTILEKPQGGGGGVKLNPPGPSGFIHEKGGRRIYDL